MLERAFQVANAGLKVTFTHTVREDGTCSCGNPSCSGPGKHPIRNEWQRKATTDLEKLRADFARLAFTPNVSVVLGEQDNGRYLIAIDVDDAARFEELKVEFGSLPETLSGRSPRGQRLFYYIPANVETHRIRNRTAFQGKPGVDVKASGGQVVVFGKNAGGEYSGFDPSSPIAELPASWVMPLLDKFTVPEKAAGYTSASLQSDRVTKTKFERYLVKALGAECSLLARCTEGSRNNATYTAALKIFSLISGLKLGGEWRRAGDQLVEAACMTGLPEREARAAVASAAKFVEESGNMRMPRTVLLDEHASKGPSALVGSEKSTCIRLDPGDFAGNVDAIREALRECHDLYARNGVLINSRGNRPTVEELKLTIHRVRSFEYTDKKGETFPCFAPESELKAVLSLSDLTELRELVGTSSTPILRPDGTIAQVSGYDTRTRYLLDIEEGYPEVSESPTKEDAVRARDELLDLVCDFPFEAEYHKSTWLALLLSLVARPAIQGGVPFFIVSATASGSGKGLLTTVASRIALGGPVENTDWTDNRDEFSKRVTAALLARSRFVVYDNFVGVLQSGLLEGLLTSDTWTGRELGKSRSLTLPNTAVWAATGNGMSVKGDMQRRCLNVRLNYPAENPETRSGFKYRELEEHVIANRKHYLAAALTILRAHAVAGRPGGRRLASFGPWSDIVASAVEWVGLPNPIESQANVARVDVGANYDAIIVETLYKLGQQLTAAKIAELAFELGTYPSLREAFEGCLGVKRSGDKPSAVRLGIYLNTLEGRVINGKKLMVGRKKGESNTFWVVTLS